MFPKEALGRVGSRPLPAAAGAWLSLMSGCSTLVPASPPLGSASSVCQNLFLPLFYRAIYHYPPRYAKILSSEHP